MNTSKKICSKVRLGNTGYAQDVTDSTYLLYVTRLQNSFVNLKCDSSCLCCAPEQMDRLVNIKRCLLNEDRSFKLISAAVQTIDYLLKIFSLIMRILAHVCENRHVESFSFDTTAARDEEWIHGKYVSILLDLLQRTEDYKHEKCCEIFLMDLKHVSLLRFLEDDRAVRGQI